MKKISLKDVKNGLSRDEMRQISGGCLISCGGSCILYTDSGNKVGRCVVWGGGFVFCGCYADGQLSYTCRGN
jgi:hypothetical protein